MIQHHHSSLPLQSNWSYTPLAPSINLVILQPPLEHPENEVPYVHQAVGLWGDRLNLQWDTIILGIILRPIHARREEILAQVFRMTQFICGPFASDLHVCIN